ncbi:MAG TPA: hypothetical protein VFZ33_20880 [Chitinophagaceae bacterium]
MEVHAHTHTARKKWTHYFWEFLMLFLAVFCGFLAEYQLEHQIEKDREKQYMQSLLEDLSADTIMINGSYMQAQNQKNLHDSILELLYYKQQLTDNAISQLYTLHYSLRLTGADFEDRTKTQLKNSGGMRLIRKKNVNDSILAYWKRTEAIERIGDRVTEIGNDISRLASKIFHTKYIIPGDEALAVPKGIRPGARLIDKEPKLLDEYSNLQYTRRTRLMVIKERLFTMKARATRLMELIKREYHLK